MYLSLPALVCFVLGSLCITIADYSVPCITRVLIPNSIVLVSGAFAMLSLHVVLSLATRFPADFHAGAQHDSSVLLYIVAPPLYMLLSDPCFWNTVCHVVGYFIVVPGFGLVLQYWIGPVFMNVACGLQCMLSRTSARVSCFVGSNQWWDVCHGLFLLCLWIFGYAMSTVLVLESSTATNAQVRQRRMESQIWNLKNRTFFLPIGVTLAIFFPMVVVFFPCRVPLNQNFYFIAGNSFFFFSLLFPLLPHSTIAHYGYLNLSLWPLV